MRLLLLVVATVVSGDSLQPDQLQGRRFNAVPVQVYGPDFPSFYGPVSQRHDFLEHVLFDYRISPHEVMIRHKGQNPIAYQPPSQPSQYTALSFESGPDPPGFQRGQIESHPAQVYRYPITYIGNEFDSDESEDGRIPLRDAVEHIPLEAESYIAARESADEELSFYRGEVEAFPRFQSPSQEGTEDEQLDVVVLYAFDDKYGWAGHRASVESHPLDTPAQDPEEAYPMLPQLNSRPFGHLSESTLYDNPDSVDFPSDVVVVGDTTFAELDLTEYNPNMRSQSTDYKLVCYYGGWSVYRPAPFDFSVLDIDPFSCTHVIYSFAGLKENEHTIQALDEELDIVKGAYKAAVGLKEQNPSLKVMIAIGGWNEGGKKYSDMASTKERRDKFVQSVVSFLQEHKFDGLDLDWEYPGASDRGGRWADKANFADLVEELATAFKPHGWILSAAVSPAKFRVNEGYDVPRLAQHLDFINVMTYDLRGPWDGRADHHSPIESRPSDAWAYKSLNAKDGMNYWAEKGAPKDKLILGIPFYGRSFTLSSKENTEPGARISSGGTAGQYTQERGFLAYYEVCMEERNGGWTYKSDSAGGSYMYKGDQWVGWDDAEYVTKKMDLVKSERFGGAMIWAIDLDDYLGVCGTKWPLLTAMRRGLASSSPPTDPVPPVTEQQPPVDNVPGPPEETTLRPVTAVTPSTIKTPVFTPPTSGACNEGVYQRDAGDCGSYFLCVHGDWQRFSCQPPLHWDQNKRICDWPNNVKCKAVAGQTPPSSETSPLEEITTTSTPSPPPPQIAELEPVSSSGSLSGISPL
ncbi:Cht3p [Halocaridina rubra]|uniref:chitinase n=1 Tax=Halocaridina rubra TaxID=373956 RepID=A0AAN8WXV8_HALRR